MVPPPAVTAQVAGAFAVRVMVPPAVTLAGFGVMAKAITLAVALPLVPVPESEAEMVAAPMAPAVNSPLDVMAPAVVGLTDQVTVPVAPVAVNGGDCPCTTLAGDGETLTPILVTTVMLTGVVTTTPEVASAACSSSK